MCSSALFYLTVDVQNGLPNQEQGCLYPFAKDFGQVFEKLGNTLIASGFFFILMLILVFPLCCYNKDSDTAGGVFHRLEGGEKEPKNTNNVYLLETNKVNQE